MPLYKHLVDAGYSVFTYDLRNHGGSAVVEGGKLGLTNTEYQDVIGAVRYVKDHYPEKKHYLYSQCYGTVSTMRAMEESPAWSPDGSRIAFMSDRDGNFEIYVMNADGSGPTRLTKNPESDAYPVWSADGSRIAFQSERDGNYEVYVMNADGSRQTNLTDNPAGDGNPTWSP